TGGDGSTENPYTIADVYGLQGIGTLRGKSFALANDIDASGTSAWNNGLGFKSIGDAKHAFRGTLDGQDHTISNLTIASTQPGFVNVGLFGVIGTTGVVRNLTIENA